MGKVYTPPSNYNFDDDLDQIVFLAGSIEMDTAEDWQVKLVNKLKQLDRVKILNPRRADWDNTLKQSINEPKFVQQVNWELDGIEDSDTVIFYFDKNTKSPITLMELGMVGALPVDNVIVCCPEGFWRKGNVDIYCSRMKKRKQNVIQCNNLNELITITYDFLKGEDQRVWGDFPE